MLELWLCPSRKQNTARVMQALCEKTAQRILVVPEQFSHEAERMLCRAGGDTISRFAEVLSFSRLASRVFPSRAAPPARRRTRADGCC